MINCAKVGSIILAIFLALSVSVAFAGNEKTNATKSVNMSNATRNMTNVTKNVTMPENKTNTTKSVNMTNAITRIPMEGSSKGDESPMQRYQARASPIWHYPGSMPQYKSPVQSTGEDEGPIGGISNKEGGALSPMPQYNESNL